MKTKLFVIFLVLSSFSVTAQNTAVDKLFDKYSGKDGFTTVFISQLMFDMFKNVNTDDKDFDSLIKGLKSIRILTAENPQTINTGINFYKEIMKDLPEADYKELMVIKEKGQDTKFLIKELQGKISELLLVSGGSKNNVFICIQGNINLNSVAKLSKNMNIQGMQSLEKVEGKK